MTIQGALYELNQMMKNEDIPLYLTPTLEKVIETIVDEFNQKWIPVSEKLPKDGSWAIFTDGSTISVERYKADAEDHFYPNGRWFSFDNATAWMPLPEPYKAVSE